MTAKTAKASTKKTKTVKSKSATAKSVVASKPILADNKKADNKPKPEGKKNFRLWYLRLGIVLIVLAVAVVAAGKSAAVPVTVQYMAKDALATEVAGHTVLAPAVRHLFDVQTSWLVAKFLVLLGASYLVTATILRKKYEAWLERGITPMRWVGLGAAGGAMVVTVAMLSGVSDISTLMLAFGSTALAALLIATIEAVNPGRALRCALGIGAIVATLFPLLIFVRTAGSVALFDGALPSYLYYVYAVVVLFTVAMGLAAYMTIKRKGRWASTAYAERMFIGLAFLASLMLALQIFAGALQP